MTDAVNCLNGLLRGEISAVETYGQALKNLSDPTVTKTLSENQACHLKRVAVLQDKIAGMGGQPCSDSGAWGSFAKFMEGSASALGDKPSIDMLEEGEDHGLQAYRDGAEKCECGETRTFINSELLPAQEKTHEAASFLKRQVHSATA